MWKVYLKLDAWIISKVQDAYLWLLDRTGVYVATLTFGIYAVVGLSEIMDGGSTLWCGVLIALVGFSVAPRYLMQDKGENNRFNVISMAMTSWRLRHFIIILMICSSVISAITLHPWAALANLGFVLYGYLFMIMIRDRDKKPFLKPVEKRELALQHGSN